MNRQPYQSPPRWWQPKLSPWWVRLSRRRRRRQLRRAQRLVQINTHGTEHLRAACAAGHGVLITPNHSAHFDAAALYAAADGLDQPLYFLTAWQVFGMSSALQRWALQHLGCFSIDRESTDRLAFKQAVDILRAEPFPLVIFPEGDIYHVNDRVTEFREGAAAIALSAAKRGERPVVVVPCGMKFWYLEDPTPSLHRTVSEIEARLHLRTSDGDALRDRIHRLAEAALALKELDYLGHTCEGALRDRIRYLANAVVGQMEERHALSEAGRSIPERVKQLRQRVIRQLEDEQAPPAADERRRLEREMEDLFFAVQLYSYPGDYLVDAPSWERLAETIDKFEEDILEQDLPRVRGARSVEIAFGEPLEVVADRGHRGVAAELTHQMQHRVQQLLDELNAAGPPCHRSPGSRSSASMPGSIVAGTPGSMTGASRSS